MKKVRRSTDDQPLAILPIAIRQRLADGHKPADLALAEGLDPAANRNRAEYLIDGFRVSFLHQAEWRCACREFAIAGTCRHAREAAGMRDAQALIRQRLLANVSDFASTRSGSSVRRVTGTSNRRNPA